MKDNTQEPLAKQRRRKYKRLRHGSDARCLGCGEANPEALMQANRSLFEGHHPFGEAHVPESTVTVCRNCHARLSMRQWDDEVPLKPQTTILERVIAILTAWASFLGGMADILLAIAARAVAVVAGLDRDYDGWRTKPWAV